MSNRLPTGPGSRGGRWHDPEYRRAYQKAWRDAHPEYREKERLRRAQERARRNGDPAGTDVACSRWTHPYPRPLPSSSQICSCTCGCREATTVDSFRGWVADGLVVTGLSQRELARRTGQNHTTILRFLSEKRRGIMLNSANAIYTALVQAGYSGLRCGFCRDGLHSRHGETTINA